MTKSAILIMVTPKSKKDLQTCIKIYNQYVRLNIQLKISIKEKHFIFVDIHSVQCKKIKNVLTKAPILRYQDINGPIVLSVDQ